MAALLFLRSTGGDRGSLGVEESFSAWRVLLLATSNFKIAFPRAVRRARCNLELFKLPAKAQRGLSWLCYWEKNAEGKCSARLVLPAILTRVQMCCNLWFDSGPAATFFSCSLPRLEQQTTWPYGKLPFPSVGRNCNMVIVFKVVVGRSQRLLCSLCCQKNRC